MMERSAEYKTKISIPMVEDTSRPSADRVRIHVGQDFNDRTIFVWGFSNQDQESADLAVEAVVRALAEAVYGKGCLP